MPVEILIAHLWGTGEVPGLRPTHGLPVGTLYPVSRVLYLQPAPNLCEPSSPAMSAVIMTS